MKDKGAGKVTCADESALRPKWPLLFMLLLGGTIAGWLIYLDGEMVYAGSPGGTAFGVLGFAAILFLSMYRVRRSVYRFRLGSLQNWYLAHLYIGVLSLLFVSLHTGFRVHGTFSALLVVLFVLVIVSGIVGGILYMSIPVSLAKFGREIRPLEEIEGTLSTFTREAEDFVATKPEAFQNFYKKNLAIFFNRKSVWSYLLREEREILNACREHFKRLEKVVHPAEVYDISLLGDICAARERKLFRFMKLKALRLWLYFHVPLAVGLVAALCFHIVSIWYY